MRFWIRNLLCALIPLCFKVEGRGTVVCFFLASLSSESRGGDVQFLLEPAPWIACVVWELYSLLFLFLPSSDPFVASCSLSTRKYFQESRLSLMSS